MLTCQKLSRAAGLGKRLAQAANVHGVYVHNALLRGEERGFAFGRDAADEGVCWFGPRGNLVVLGPAVALAPAVADAVAERIQRSRLPWRIAMGPAGIIDALRARCVGTPLVHRNQVYYVGDPATVDRSLIRADLRAAEIGDRERIVQATLELNHLDLLIDPARVDRRWLYDTVDERIQDGTTRVLGSVGQVDCKLDLGSIGPGGVVIEGVFTFADLRGRGLASALVASTIADLDQPVGLHVGEQNTSARRAYERAGMREIDRCRLLLLG